MHGSLFYGEIRYSRLFPTAGDHPIMFSADTEFPVTPELTGESATFL